VKYFKIRGCTVEHKARNVQQAKQVQLLGLTGTTGSAAFTAIDFGSTRLRGTLRVKRRMSDLLLWALGFGCSSLLIFLTLGFLISVLSLFYAVIQALSSLAFSLTGVSVFGLFGKPVFSFFYLVLGLYLITYFDNSSKRDGRLSRAIQCWKGWSVFKSYFNASVTAEFPLDHNQQYIFGMFPHGACTVSHFLTMTNCCGMLTNIHKGDRRDLAASILFYIPFVRDLLLFLGCVDASKETVKYNLRKRRSILIYVGGEKEQLMTKENSHKVVLKDRLGFIKLAIQHGIPLVPVYAFGENELYRHSFLFMGFRSWLQKHFQIAIPLIIGRWGSLMPFKVNLHVAIGKPIPVTKKLEPDINESDLKSLHSTFVVELTRLFDENKVAHGIAADAQLQII